MTTTFITVLIFSTAALAQEAVNPHAALIQEFEKRTAEYLKIHKQAEGKEPKTPKYLGYKKCLTMQFEKEHSQSIPLRLVKYR